MKRAYIGLNQFLPIPAEHFFIIFIIFIIFGGMGSIVIAWSMAILWSALNIAWLTSDAIERIKVKDILWPIPVKIMVFLLSLWPLLTSIKNNGRY